jgi:hypothetical protein
LRSWRNKPVESKAKTRESPANAGLLFFHLPGWGGQRILPHFYGSTAEVARSCTVAVRLSLGDLQMPSSKKSQLQAVVSCSFEGYPQSTSKKKRVCIVTYRHSDAGLFENSLRPLPNVNDL